jgi:RNA polymerase sigma factor (TIGR02999 family)
LLRDLSGVATDAVDLTSLLSRWRAGEVEARDQLLVAVYPALRAMAQQQLGNDAGHFTLRPTELAHEAFLRLQSQRLGWDNREHFHAIVATVLRRVVVDYLRRRGNSKRGGGTPFVPLTELVDADEPVIDDSVDWIQLDLALVGLEAEDPELARVVELKFFSGMKTDEIALVMSSSVATVGRQWRFAKAWLGQRLAG